MLTKKKTNLELLTRAILTLTAGSCSAAVFGQSVLLEEILVTAQKTEESLQDVPISVSSLQGDDLQEIGAQRFEDITEYVPNFSVTRDPIGDKINIRGIQSGNQAGFEQSVGTFVDGIYRGRGTQARFAFMDVERVEVLRGPQGTLFGKNTIAGALNITSARPTEELSGSVSLARNLDFEENELQGYISGSLTDNLRGRAFVLYRDMDDGYVDNRFYDEGTPQLEEFASRISLSWDVNDTTQIDFRTEIADFDHIGQPWEHASAGPLAAVGVEANLDYVTNVGATNPVLDFGSNGNLVGDSNETAITLTSQFDQGDLTIVAGHSAYDFKRFLDADFSNIDGLRFDDTEDFDQQSIEVRFESDINETISYITGVFYQQQDLVVDGLTYFALNAGPTSLQPLLQGTCDGNLTAFFGSDYATVATAGDAAATATAVASIAGTPASLVNACGLAAAFDQNGPAGLVEGVNRYAKLDQETETYAAFAQADIALSEALELTLGARFTNEQKKASQSVWAADFVERNTAQTANAAVIGFSEAAGEFLTHSFSPSDPGMTRDEDSLTWSANLTWHLNDETMLYASTSTGFKAGGFNSFYMATPSGASLTLNSEDVSFEEEEVITFEIGSKLTVWDGRGEINTAIFRTEFDDLQASVFTGGTTFVVQNAAEAVTQGIEIDSRWALSENLTMNASLGYIDFEFDSFPNQACTSSQFADRRQSLYDDAITTPDIARAVGIALGYSNGSCAADSINNLAGGTTENTPQWQAAVSFDHAHDFDNGATLDSRLDINWRDEVYRQADLDALALQDSQTKINASVVFTTPSGAWDFTAIGRNLTDEDEILYVNDTPLFNGTNQSLTAPPRSFTLRARYNLL